jgi:hypothetical protein
MFCIGARVSPVVGPYRGLVGIVEQASGSPNNGTPCLIRVNFYEQYTFEGGKVQQGTFDPRWLRLAET